MQRVRDRIESFKEERVIDGQKPHKKPKKLSFEYFPIRRMPARQGLKRKSIKRKDEPEFTKQVTVDPRDMLKRIVKKEKMN